jgi:hypothetical protein
LHAGHEAVFVRLSRRLRGVLGDAAESASFPPCVDRAAARSRTRPRDLGLSLD